MNGSCFMVASKTKSVEQISDRAEEDDEGDGKNEEDSDFEDDDLLDVESIEKDRTMDLDKDGNKDKDSTLPKDPSASGNGDQKVNGQSSSVDPKGSKSVRRVLDFGLDPGLVGSEEDNCANLLKVMELDDEMEDELSENIGIFSELPRDDELHQLPKEWVTMLGRAEDNLRVEPEKVNIDDQKPEAELDRGLEISEEVEVKTTQPLAEDLEKQLDRGGEGCKVVKQRRGKNKT